MQLKPIETLLFTLVLSCGLISCSQDKSSEKQIVYEQATFKPDQVSTKNSDNTINNLRESYTLQAGGLVQFDLLKYQDFKKNSVIFNVETSCRQNTKAATLYTRVNFKDVWQIPVVKLLPIELFATISEDTAICDFIITASDQNGSRNVNPINNILVTQILAYSNFENELVQDSQADFELSRSEYLDIPEQSEAQLICQDFSKIIKSTPIDFSLDQFQISDADDISHLSTPNQKCRILYSNSNQKQISAIFNLQFPIQATSVIGQVTPLPITSHYKNQKVMDIELVNPNSFPIKMKIGRYTTMRFVLRPLYMSAAIPQLGRMQRSVVKLVPETNDKTVINDDLFITVPGHDTVTVQAIATRDLICQGGIPSVPNTTFKYDRSSIVQGNYLLYAGTNYDYELNKMTFSYETHENQWEQIELDFIGKITAAEYSDYRYWSLPTSKQIENAFGKSIPIWTNLVEINDVCSD